VVASPRNQIAPPIQRLGGVVIFGADLAKFWKHCGSKRVRNRKQISELARSTPSSRRAPTSRDASGEASSNALVRVQVIACHAAETPERGDAAGLINWRRVRAPAAIAE
jgi:hypothetical protein